MNHIVTAGMTSKQHIDQLNNLLQQIVFNLKDAKLKGLLDSALTTEGTAKEGDKDEAIQAVKNFMAAFRQQDPNVIFGLVNSSDIYRGPTEEAKNEKHTPDKKVKNIISRLWKRVASVFREAA